MPYPQPVNAEATAYLVIEPTWRRYGEDADGNPILDGARITGVKQRLPKTTPPGSVAIKVKVRVPSGAFIPLVVDAVLDVPDSLIVRTAEVSITKPENPS